MISDEVAVSATAEIDEISAGECEFLSRKTDQIESRDLCWSRYRRRTSGIQRSLLFRSRAGDPQLSHAVIKSGSI